ncbi:MAG: type IV secretory system conjugative DNA transfer family protein [Lachnospiraceae bacterium]|nr:type IV secretory system conjugative DNA transfer family protein [Lachnospiraceae bacterium]
MVRKIINSGALLVPVAFLIIFLALKEARPDMEWTQDTWIAVGGASLVVWLLYWVNKTNNPRAQNELYDGKSAAQRPKVPEDMLYKEPTGFVFGKWKGKYVCKKIDEPGAILVQGGSGTGKSASIIQNFLLNPENKKNCNSLVCDLKHELADKILMPEDIYGPDNPDGCSIILDPLDRKSGYGWDAFYGLSDDSTDAEVHERMEVVANCIIPIPKGDGAVWSLAAQQFLRGAMTFYFREEGLRTIPDIIRAIKTENIKDVIEHIVTTAMPGSTAYTDIIGFQGMADETLYSVDMNLSQKIVQFITSPDLEWCLGDNPRKCSPVDMLERNIYLCIPEDKLQQWGQLVFLVFNQFLYWMMSLPEIEAQPDRKRFAMILDETVALLAGIGAPMPLLSQCLRIGARGKGCTMVVCVQSIAGLYQTMEKEQTRDMVSNMAYKYILDSSDSETSREIQGWCGKFLKRKVSSSGGGMDQKNTISFEKDDIVDEKDLMALPKSGDVILVSNRAGYLRLEKCMVFKDPYYKDLLDKVKQAKKKGELNNGDERRETDSRDVTDGSEAGVGFDEPGSSTD